MITEHDLQEAIAECLGQRNPTAQTCIKLAAFYTIKNSLYGESAPPETRSYSYAAPPDPAGNIITYTSGTEFGRLIEGMDADEVWPVIDELISDAIKALNPRLYDAVLRKLR